MTSDISYVSTWTSTVPILMKLRSTPKNQWSRMFLSWSEMLTEQECILVGYVPEARRPYAGVCFPGWGLVLGGWGVSSPGGSGGGGLLPGGSGGGVSAPRGVCSGGGDGGFSLPGDPPCEQNHTHV